MERSDHQQAPMVRQSYLSRRKMANFGCVSTIERSTRKQSRTAMHCHESMSYSTDYTEQKYSRNSTSRADIIRLRLTQRTGTKQHSGHDTDITNSTSCHLA